jgi:RNA polymerase sigma-70 factor (ECF subfamily)
MGDRRMTESIARFEERILIEMALAGQAECFSVLMDRHITAVRRCIGAMIRNRSDVEDLVQDTFLKAWLRLSTFRFEAGFRAWITRVAVNEALALYRRRRSRSICPAPVNFDAFQSPSESPDEALARSEAHRTVRRAITGLPKEYQQILTLCDLEQLSANEAARQLQSSIPLVKARLFRARRMLCAAVKEQAA